MRLKLMTIAAAAALAAPLAANSQGGSSPGSGQAAQAPQPELVVITITPVERRVMDQQRRESMFRALDANGDGAISQAEAGVNVQLVNAFNRLDRDGNRVIERQEFAGVHVDEGSGAAPQASAGQGGGQAQGGQAQQQAMPARDIEERSKGIVGQWPQDRQPSAAAGGTAQGGQQAQQSASDGANVPLPSRSIEERSKGVVGHWPQDTRPQR